MPIELTNAQKGLFAEIATSEDFGEEYELKTEDAGDSCFGTVTAVTIVGKEKKLELILKAASTDDKVRSVNPVRLAYLREIFVYEDILTIFSDFEEEMGIEDVFFGYPKMYGSIQGENNECLVLENLNADGYRLWDGKVPMNADHVSLVFTEYAKFHAVSLAMSHKKPCTYFNLTKDLTNVFETHSLVMARAALDYGRKAVLGNAFATKALDRLSGVVEYFINEEMERCGSKVVVIHKDGWSNNMMFKYEDQQNTEKPTKTNIIDWQLTQTGSPVLDLAYFLFTCGSIEVIINYATYLKIYHDALSERLGKLSCDVSELYPFNRLVVHWHKYSKFGLFMAVIMIKFMMSEKDEVPNIAQMARTGMSFVDRLKFESVHDDAYNRRIAGIITVMARSSLI